MKGNNAMSKNTEFNFSEETWKLWKPSLAKINNVREDSAAKDLIQLFVLNGDSKKARLAASRIVAVSKSIPNTTIYYAEARKVDGTHIAFTVTGEQLKKRALAIASLGDTEVEFKVIAEGKKSSTRKSGVKTSSALIPSNVKTPAKKAKVESIPAESIPA
jgi:hypothetical protein